MILRYFNLFSMSKAKIVTLFWTKCTHKFSIFFKLFTKKFKSCPKSLDWGLRPKHIFAEPKPKPKHRPKLRSYTNAVFSNLFYEWIFWTYTFFFFHFSSRIHEYFQEKFRHFSNMYIHFSILSNKWDPFYHAGLHD